MKNCLIYYLSGSESPCLVLLAWWLTLLADIQVHRNPRLVYVRCYSRLVALIASGLGSPRVRLGWCPSCLVSILAGVSLAWRPSCLVSAYQLFPLPGGLICSHLCIPGDSHCLRLTRARCYPCLVALVARGLNSPASLPTAHLYLVLLMLSVYYHRVKHPRHLGI
jgi:hypothetical protein